ncbi:MAG TPA: serine/threonine-protein kinase [Chroococcidiopsis sp.]
MSVNQVLSLTASQGCDRQSPVIPTIVAMEDVLAGHYQMVRHLGGGGFGQTFLAQDSHLPGRPLCVVKQLKPASTDPTSLEVAKRLFDREAETLYRLGSHDQIPRLLAHFEQNSEFYLVQEYIAGQPLDKELQPGKQLAEEAVISLLSNVLQVLAFVHQQHVIHRDIKPANLIRRSRDNKIVLIDFGAVKQVSSQTVCSSAGGNGHSNLTIAIGSPGYMPSEQQSFQPRFSSDIYAVGIVCLQALAGLPARMLPREEATGEICCAALGDRLSISPQLAAILDKMVRYDYRQRYDNAMAAWEAVQTAFGRTGPEPIYQPMAIETTEAAFPAIATEALTPTPTAPSPLASPAPAVLPTQQLPEPANLSAEAKYQLERLLLEAIGPVAPILLNTAIAQSVTLSDLVERLTSRIPAQGQSPFRQQASRIVQGSSSAANRAHTQPDYQTAAAPMTEAIATSTLTPTFTKHCEQELAKAIGPIASMLVQRAIARQPQITSVQLIEALALHLRDPKAVEKFRATLLALL